MDNYSISEQYVLPSKAEIYAQKFDPHITLRSMTTLEEMRRLAPSEFTYRNMCQIIDDCITEKLPISCYDMCVGDYQYLMYKLRCVTYGSEYTVIHKCRYCGCETQEVLNLEELPIKHFEEESLKYLKVELPVSKRTVTLNIQTPRMLDEVQEAVKERRRKQQNADKVDMTLVFLLCNLIREIDGKSPNVVHLEEWVKQLPMRDVNMILTSADKFNNSIGIDTNLHVICDICSIEYDTQFIPDTEFFRPSLDI